MSGHLHHHHHVTEKKGLLISVFLNLGITLAEVAGGLISGSLSLLSDALHNFNDTVAMVASYVAIKLSEKEHDEKRTFGYRRAQILAALMNSILLIVAALLLFRESFFRLINPEPIRGYVMLGVAVVGLLANLISVLLLKGHASHNLNIRTAYLHLMADTLSSVAVVLGGIAIILWNWYLIDPILTVLIGIYILKEGIGAFVESVEILMESVPAELDLQEVKRAVESLPEVENIHHLHVWRLDDKNVLLEAHIDLKSDVTISVADTIRQKIESLLRKRFGISHVTLQMEFNSCPEKSLIRKSL